MNRTLLSVLLGALACGAVASCNNNDVTIGTAEPGLSGSVGGPVAAGGSAGGLKRPSSAKAPVLPEPDAPAWIGIPRTTKEVMQVVNGGNKEAYAGKTGTLKGRITIKGDPPPKTDVVVPAGCPEAAAMYGKAWRVGPDNALADALVAVTGYQPNFVPPDKPAATVKIQGCAYDSRTVALGFGQRIEVVNGDPTGSYMPFLDGAEYRAVMMAMPEGDPVKLYPFRPAIDYVLRDFQGRPYMSADVFVLKFSTVDVTTIDGRYEITRIPVGKVKVDAMLPALEKRVGREIEIQEGDNVLDLEMTYDKSADKLASRRPDTWTRGSDPSRPAASAGHFGGPPATAAPSGSGPTFPRDIPR